MYMLNTIRNIGNMHIYGIPFTIFIALYIICVTITIYVLNKIIKKAKATLLHSLSSLIATATTSHQQPLPAATHELKIPTHVAVIMDGNGRWATAKSLPRIEGHKEGLKRLEELTYTANKLGITYLTVYAFSTQNWGRPHEELKGLNELLKEFISAKSKQLIENNIRIKFIGFLDIYSDEVQKNLSEIENLSEKNTGTLLTICASYGSREEICQAVRNIISAEQKQEQEQIDENLMSRYMKTSPIPDPDILIRTGGEYRISNFMLWQIAYSELYFTDTYFPDFNESEFQKAIAEYSKRKRRFGKIDDISQQEDTVIYTQDEIQQDVAEYCKKISSNSIQPISNELQTILNNTQHQPQPHPTYKSYINEYSTKLLSKINKVSSKIKDYISQKHGWVHGILTIYDILSDSCTTTDIRKNIYENIISKNTDIYVIYTELKKYCKNISTLSAIKNKIHTFSNMHMKIANILIHLLNEYEKNKQHDTMHSHIQKLTEIIFWIIYPISIFDDKQTVSKMELIELANMCAMYSFLQTNPVAMTDKSNDIIQYISFHHSQNQKKTVSSSYINKIRKIVLDETIQLYKTNKLENTDSIVIEIKNIIEKAESVL
jgi:undecaprenyl diphosphate synthase